MHFSVKDHRVYDGRKPITFRDSPNKGGAFSPEGIVLHDTAGRLERHSSVNWFLDQSARASAHFVVERDGEITQLAKLNERCWHAGASRYGNRANVNDFAFGIEIVNLGKMSKTAENVFKPWFKKSFHQGEDGLEFVRKQTAHHGTGYWHDYSQSQVEAVVGLCRALASEYRVKWVTTHWFISPGRKVDTNPLFPLDEVRAAVFGYDPAGDDDGVTVAEVNQRRWPSYRDNVIQVIPRAQAVELIRSGRFRSDSGDEELWHLVRYGEHEGWVNSHYVDLA